MEIKLNKLILQNFKGFGFTLEPNGHDVSIFGQNATGKTTLADAFSWLLFDKDSLGRSDFEIKNLDSGGNQEHGLEHTVEAELSYNGNPITLKKIYKEVWTKKRGSAQSTFTGNTNDYFIDGVPVKESEYKTKISEIAGDEASFRMLTSPTVFPALPWQKQRSLLLDICGDITDAQVIDTDDALAPLTDLLKKYTVSKTPIDDLRKVVTSRRTEINKHIDAIPIRIDECKKGMPDISGLILSDAKAEVATYEHFLSEAKLKLQGIDNGSNIADLSKKLAGIDAEISKLERDHFNETTKEITKLNAKINEVTEAKAAHERKSKNLLDLITEKKNSLPRIETKLEELRARWVGIDEEKFQDTTESVCPACGQSLPSDRVESAREKALAKFNREKAGELTDIDVEGKKLAEQKASILSEIEKLQKEILELPAFETAYNLDELTAKREELKKLAEDYGHTDMAHATEWKQLHTDKGYITEQIEQAKGSVSVDKEAVQKEIDNITVSLAISRAHLDKFSQREAGEKRIEELKAEEKKLSREFEELEKQLFLIESFTKRKVSLLNEKINNKFSVVRFKLFNVLVNGGIEDCCEITVNGVPFGGGLNSAARTQAGLDIINTLQEHYQMECPIWIDNRESCTVIPDMRCQVISLYVSPEDKALRVERADRKMAAA